MRTVVCPVCGVEFTTSSGVKKYCSSECFSAARKEWNRQYSRSVSRKEYRNRADRKIAHTLAVKKYMSTEKGKATLRRYNNSNTKKELVNQYKLEGRTQRYSFKYRHSEIGQRTYKNWRNSENGRISKQRSSVKRRIFQKMNSEIRFDRGIHWKTVSDRQGLNCYICGRLCDPNGPYMYRPTVDHVIPISLGGTDTWDNVKIACRSCNSSKRATMIQQMQQGG